MRAIVSIAALMLLAGVSGPVRAATVTDFTSVHFLGDSLTDTGNVFDATFGRVPGDPPYWHGRFSNGPVWSDRFADLFRDADLPRGNHAWGGAQARTNADFSFDLPLQALQYRRTSESRRGDRPLLAMWAGGNDVLAATGRGGIRDTGRRAADAVADVAEDLAGRGVNDFLVFNLPDLGRIPDTARDSDPAVSRRASAGSRAFNRRLGRHIDDLRADGVNVTEIDTFAFFRALRADPGAFGVRNVRRPCIDADGDVCGDRAARRRAFYDDIHPNRVVHRRIFEIAAEAMFGTPSQVSPPVPSLALASASAPAPVPLPAPAALLVAGLALLGAAARRRA